MTSVFSNETSHDNRGEFEGQAVRQFKSSHDSSTRMNVLAISPSVLIRCVFLIVSTSNKKKKTKTNNESIQLRSGFESYSSRAVSHAALADVWVHCHVHTLHLALNHSHTYLFCCRKHPPEHPRRIRFAAENCPRQAQHLLPTFSKIDQ